MQTVSVQEELLDKELEELSVSESFNKDRLKMLIDKVVVYGEDDIQIVWKMGNTFQAEISI